MKTRRILVSLPADMWLTEQSLPSWARSLQRHRVDPSTFRKSSISVDSQALNSGLAAPQLDSVDLSARCGRLPWRTL